MNKVVISLAIFAITFPAAAAPLTVDSTGYDWRKATTGDRKMIVATAYSRVQGAYPASEMFACIAEAFSGKPNDNILSQKISTIFILCHAQLK